MSLHKNPRRAALVINTHSRKAERTFFMVLDKLEAAGVIVTDLFPVRNPDHLSKAVEKAIAQGNQLIIIGGGDGTISAMSGHFVNRDVTLGILPLGTANSFIKSLGIPTGIDAAISVLAQGKEERIDVGSINGTYFANALSYGYTTLVAYNTSTRMKRVLGIAAYALEGFIQALRARPFTIDVTCDGVATRLTTYQAIVANGTFYGPTTLARSATLNSGKLVLLTMQNMHRRTLLHAWITTLFGKSLASQTTLTITGKEIEITPKPAQAITVDGEILHANTLILKIHPEAIKVLVPANFQKKKRAS